MGAGPVVTYTLLFISLYFEVFLLVSFLERRLSKRADGPAGSEAYLPSVAIVVPCFNEAATVAGTLESLCALDYPAGKLELLVVDDGSTDDTFAVAQAFARRQRAQLTLLQKENGGKHTAMNLALAHTDAELIGCLDADSIVEPSALRAIVPSFMDTRLAAITPGIHVRAPQTLLQHIQHVEYRLSLFTRFIMASLGSVFITPGPFSVFRAAVVRELGGWRHGHATEDMELALRIQIAGHLIGNAPRAVVHTNAPRGLRALVRQRIRWTYGWLRNALEYRSLIGNRAYGNLGIIVLPAALVSIITALFFYVRMLWNVADLLLRDIVRFQVTGTLPHPSFDLFYLDTSALLFLVVVGVVLVLIIIDAGTRIGTDSRALPLATPLFLCCYCVLAPLWLSAAVVRATLNTGVRWR